MHTHTHVFLAPSGVQGMGALLQLSKASLVLATIFMCKHCCLWDLYHDIFHTVSRVCLLISYLTESFLGTRPGFNSVSYLCILHNTCLFVVHALEASSFT